MTSALRWAEMRAILMFHNCEGQSHKTVSTDHHLWSERRAEADSNRGPSAYQPNALPLGQTGTWPSGRFYQITVLPASIETKQNKQKDNAPQFAPCLSPSQKTKTKTKQKKTGPSTLGQRKPDLREFLAPNSSVLNNRINTVGAPVSGPCKHRVPG